MKKKQNFKESIKDVIDTSRNNIKKYYKKTLLFDLACLGCALLIFIIATLFLMSGWIKLGTVLPDTINMITKITDDPAFASEYKDELESTGRFFDIFIWSSVSIIIVSLTVLLLCYSFFHLKIFEVLNTKKTRKPSLWKFCLLNLLAGILFVIILLVGLLIFKESMISVFAILWFLFSLYLINLFYFSFIHNDKKNGLFKITFDLFTPLSVLVFFVVCISSWIFWTLLSLVTGFNAVLWLLIIIIIPLLSWPVGRIILFSTNEVSIKNVK